MSDAHREEIEKLETLYQEHPEGRIFTHLAEAYRKAGELDRAREVLEAGIQRHPDYSSAHVVLGRVFLDEERPEEAAAEFERVLDLDPHNLIATRALGDIARERGDGEQALDYYERLLDQEPSEELNALVQELSGAPVAGAPEIDPDAEEDAWEPTEPADEAGWESMEPGAEDATEREIEGGEAEEPMALDPGRAWAPEGESDEELADPASGDDGWEPEDVEEEATAVVEEEAADAVEEEAIPELPTPEPADDESIEEETTGEVAGLPVRSEEALHTETIAQVYARQGLYERAAEVYRELIRTRSDDSVLRGRLAEMEELAAQQAGADAPDEAAEQADEEPDWQAAGEMSAEEVPEAAAFEVEGFESTEFDTGDVREEPLDGFEPGEHEPEPDAGEEEDDSIWMEAWDVAAVDEETTPHAWVEDEPEDGSRPIREYLGGLLDWRPTGSTERGTEAPEASDASGDRSAVGDPPEAHSAEESATETRASLDEDDDDLDMFRSWLESLKQ